MAATERTLTVSQVDKVTLVFQQWAVLKANIDQNIEYFYGAKGCDTWMQETWTNEFAQNMIIVCTAEILYQCLAHAFITMEQINLLILDEAHHAKKDHTYARSVIHLLFIYMQKSN